MNESKNKILIVIIIFFSIFIFLFMLTGYSSCSGSYGYSMMNYMYSNPIGWMFGFLAITILWAFAISILYYFIKLITQQSKTEIKIKRRK